MDRCFGNYLLMLPGSRKEILNKDMNFSELFQTVWVTVISGNKNINHKTFLFSIFHFIKQAFL